MDSAPLTIGGSGLYSQETTRTVLFVILGIKVGLSSFKSSNIYVLILVPTFLEEYLNY